MENKLITWTVKYNIGYEKIDTQHKKLIEMLNKLYCLFTEGKAHESINAIVEDMIEYTKYHFKTEERYLKKHNYSGIKNHIKEHRLFITQAKDFHKDLKTGLVVISYEVLLFLKSWFIDHILGADIEFRNEFENRNIIIN